MKLTWYNSAVVSAPSRLVSSSGKWRKLDFPIRYGIFEHPSRGLVIIDMGYGPDLFLSRDINVILYRNLFRPRLIETGDVETVVNALGTKPGDIRHIVLTHLHADHICGLARFPNAQIHASAKSLKGWQNPRGFSSTHKGFFPSLLPVITDRDVVPVENTPTILLPWGGTGYDVFGDNSLVAIDLPGHMEGHIGVLFPKLSKPVLHAADTDWTFASLMQNENITLPARLIIDDLKKLSQSKFVVRQAIACGFDITLSHDVLR
jgi:glyoxylase-like metal-dependent hydrolase (beta-lactamase superfamily II)